MALRVHLRPEDLRRPIWGCPKTPLLPPVFGLCRNSFCSNIAPTVIGVSCAHRVPEVFESGTVRILHSASAFYRVHFMER